MSVSARGCERSRVQYYHTGDEKAGIVIMPQTPAAGCFASRAMPSAYPISFAACFPFASAASA